MDNRLTQSYMFMSVPIKYIPILRTEVKTRRLSLSETLITLSQRLYNLVSEGSCVHKPFHHECQCVLSSDTNYVTYH